MKRFYIISGIFILLLAFTSCLTQSRMGNTTSCNGKVIVQYDKGGLNSNAAKIDRSVTVVFMNDFNGKIQGYIDGNLIFDDLVITKGTSGKSNKGFTYDYGKEMKTPVLKIQKDNDRCFDIKLNEKYKFIYVFFDLNKQWIVRFSNKYYLDD